MSLDAAKLFMARLKNDEAFARQVVQCKDVKERMRFVRAAGYDLLVEELREICGDMNQEQIEWFYGSKGICRG